MGYGIRDIRQKSIFDQYGQDNGMGMGDMSMDYGNDSYGIRPIPSVGPYEETPPSELFGRENVPSLGDPNSTIAPQASSGQAGMGAPRPYDTSGNINRTLETIGKVFTPETIDRDRLRALMDAAPERQAPSFARALVAGALSQKAADPIATSEAVMYAPHRRNMADWTAKTEPFYKTAELENRMNVNERTLAGNVVTSMTQADRLAESARQADQKNEVARVRAENDAIRARAYEYKNRGAEIVKAGSRYVAIFPDGTRKDAGPSGGMDRESEIDLLGKWDLKSAQAAGGQYYQTDSGVVRGNPRDPDSPVPPSGARQISGSGKGSELSPTDAEKARESEAVRLYNTDAGIRKWTELKGGKVVAKKRPEEGYSWNPFGYSAEDVQDYNRVMNIVWPTKGIGPGNVDTRREGGGTIRSNGEEYPYTDLPDDVNPPPATQKGIAAGVTPPEATPKPKWQPRPEYGGATVPSDRSPLNDIKNAWGALNEAGGKATPTEGYMRRQVATEDGYKVVPEGEAAIKDVKTGKVLLVPKENLAKAIASGLYTEVK